MVTAQKLKEAEITEQDSLLLTRNLLRIAIFNISYIRGLFPEKYFNDKNVPALEMKIKKLMPMDAESRRLIDWMEKGVYDALQKKYLKTLLFCVCEAVDGPMIEEYAFSFSYSASDSQDVSINVNRTGNKKGGTIQCNSETVITPNQMRSSACKMIRTLVQLMRTLDKMPIERTILMKLLYYDDVTPPDYEPPFFRGCKEEESQNSWTKNPLKMEVGNVNSKHLVIALKVKSVLDPCEDENEDVAGDGISFGADSAQSDDPSMSDDATAQEQNNDFVVAPAGKNIMDDEENTEDPDEDEQQFVRVKNWIDTRHFDSVELTDIQTNFPDISIALTEEILERLMKEGILYKTGEDSYSKDKLKVFEYDSRVVKVEDGQGVQNESTYMKALYHALQMKYVAVAKLQSKLGKGTNVAGVRGLVDKMVEDGYVDPKAHRRFGNRVIQSAVAQKKLAELKKAFENERSDEWKQKAVDNGKDNSTCGILRSIGSDLTRMRIESDTNQQASMRTQQTVASRESVAQGVGNGKTNEAETAACSKSSQEKKSRKTSMVKDPIQQNMKRLKSQPA